ncbi:hypothetical protein OXX80_002896 [Metschnikowia pulcherrima]
MRFFTSFIFGLLSASGILTTSITLTTSTIRQMEDDKDILQRETHISNIRENSLNTDLALHVCGVNALENNPQDIEVRIEFFIDHLKSFITETNFDSASFALNSIEYDRQLKSIQISSRNIVPCLNELNTKINFAERMLKLMTEVTQTVSLTSHSSGQYLLLEKVLDLQVRLLSLRDSQGSPDPKIINFAETVLAYRRQLSSLERDLARILSQSPLKPKVKLPGLQAHFNEASRTLRILESYVNETRHAC